MCSVTVHHDYTALAVRIHQTVHSHEVPTLILGYFKHMLGYRNERLVPNRFKSTVHNHSIIVYYYCLLLLSIIIVYYYLVNKGKNNNHNKQ